MQSQEEKLNLFLQAINDYAEKQRLRILSEMEEQTGAELSRAEKEALSTAYRLIQKETAEVRGSIAYDLAARELEGRRRLFEHRSAIEKDVFERVVKKLSAFTASKDYAPFLRSAAQVAAKHLAAASEGVVFHLREEDMRYADDIRAAYGAECRFVADSGIQLGGLLAVSPALGRALDLTLDGRLENQHEWFEENAELSIS